MRNNSVLLSLYSRRFTNYVETQFSVILDEVISGKRHEALDVLINQLKQMGNKGQFYIIGMNTPDALEFNDMLANALVDIAFYTGPAIEI